MMVITGHALTLSLNVIYLYLPDFYFILIKLNIYKHTLQPFVYVWCYVLMNINLYFNDHSLSHAISLFI